MNNRTQSSFHYKKKSPFQTLDQDAFNKTIKRLSSIYNEKINFLQSEIENLRLDFNKAVENLKRSQLKQPNQILHKTRVGGFSEEKLYTCPNNNINNNSSMNNLKKQKKIFNYKGQLKKKKNFLSYFPINDDEKNKIRHMIIDANFNNVSTSQKINKSYRNNLLATASISHKSYKSQTVLSTEPDVKKCKEYSPSLIKAISIMIQHE